MRRGRGVSVLLGHGDGTFGPARNYDVGSNVQSVVVGDYNMDGQSDLAATCFDGGICWLRGNGDGTFRSPVYYSAAWGTRFLVNGDFDADGKPDLAVVDYNANAISILTGSGTGSFATPRDYGTGGWPGCAVSGDFDEDGKPDLAVACYGTRTIEILTNIGLESAGVTLANRPGRPVLFAPSPNPMSTATTIGFDLPAAAPVLSEVYDVSGRRIRVLSPGTVCKPGRQSLVWDGRDESGRPVPAGIYLTRLRTGAVRETFKITVARCR